MTEAEWLAAADPTPMQAFLRGKVSDRKLRLFAVACCRRIWPHLSTLPVKEAVTIAERYADGVATAKERREAETELANLFQEVAHKSGRFADVGEEPPPGDTRHRAMFAVQTVYQTVSRVVNAEHVAFSVLLVFDAYASSRQTRVSRRERLFQSRLCREVFGNPFRPVTFDPAWLTPTVTTLARQMYDARDFSPMPIFADALQDAGCETPDVLDHCRGDGPHVRGCWVVDLLLGKS